MGLVGVQSLDRLQNEAVFRMTSRIDRTLSCHGFAFRHAQKQGSRTHQVARRRGNNRQYGDQRAGVHQCSVCSATSRAIVALSASDKPSIQLATAKLPEQIDTEQFATKMYQWASTMTSASGQTLPFTLPLRTKKLSNGFQISLLRISQGEPVPVAHIIAEVEEEASVGNIFFVRFYEGEGSDAINRKLPKDPQERLKTIIEGLLDVTTIMRTMKAAIKEVAVRSKKQQ